MENQKTNNKESKEDSDILVSTPEQDELISLLTKRFPSVPDININHLQEDIELIIESKNIKSTCRLLKDSSELNFNYLECISLVDYEEKLEAVYHLTTFKLKQSLVIKTSISVENPEIDSVIDIWRAADWFEREAHDLFGVTFLGHPNLEPLLLFEGFEGYPGRKNFPINDYKEW